MRLPPEIFEIIVGILHIQGCLSDIRHCALAGRDLLAVSQRRLFASVKLVQSVERSAHIRGLGLRATPHPMRQIRRPLSQNPVLRTYIRELVVRYMVTFDNVGSDIESEDYDTLNLLSNVQTLTIAFAYFGQRVPDEMRLWSESGLGGLRRTLGSFAQRNPVTFLLIFGIREIPSTFLQRFCQLRSLTMARATAAPLLSQDKFLLTEAPDFPSPSPAIIKLKELELREEASSCAERFILSPKPVLNVSQVTQAVLGIGSQDWGHMFARIIPLLSQVEGLNVTVEVPDDHSRWLEGQLLSILQPSARSTWRWLKVSLKVGSNAFPFPPFGGFASELASVRGCNVLEGIIIDTSLSPGCLLTVPPSQWTDLEEIIRSPPDYDSRETAAPYPHLRALQLKVKHQFHYDNNGEDPHQAAVDAKEEWETLFKEKYGWCKANMDFCFDVSTGVPIYC
ncbi:hypothetical protein BKA70DRAFT_1499982 [Coprinopsis sp. MPI-PUGE-AT-0042]|nr:hypothetical protein BKA70DRAFT_1499982 [Coprinopsis sp. MPI-PUGE-AT-0042]